MFHNNFFQMKKMTMLSGNKFKKKYSHWFDLTLLLGLILFVSSCSRNVPNKTDEEKEGDMVAKNNIKSISEFVVEIQNDVRSKEQIRHKKDLDNSGKIIKTTNYTPDGAIENFILSDYDDHGHLITKRSMKSDSVLIFREERTYDRNDNRNAYYFYLPYGTCESREFVFYDNRHRILKTWYWNSGLKAITDYSYEEMLLTEMKKFSPRGELLGKTTYKYDKKNHLLEDTQLSPDNSILRKTVFVYNMDNKKNKEISYFGNQIQSILTYEYDRKGLLISEKKYDSNEKIQDEFRFQYEYY